MDGETIHLKCNLSVGQFIIVKMPINDPISKNYAPRFPQQHYHTNVFQHNAMKGVDN